MILAGLADPGRPGTDRPDAVQRRGFSGSSPAQPHAYCAPVSPGSPGGAGSFPLALTVDVAYVFGMVAPPRSAVSRARGRHREHRTRPARRRGGPRRPQHQPLITPAVTIILLTRQHPQGSKVVKVDLAFPSGRRLCAAAGALFVPGVLLDGKRSRTAGGQNESCGGDSRTPDMVSWILRVRGGV